MKHDGNSWIRTKKRGDSANGTVKRPIKTSIGNEVENGAATIVLLGPFRLEAIALPCHPRRIAKQIASTLESAGRTRQAQRRGMAKKTGGSFYSLGKT
jgi:hypothetical protein